MSETCISSSLASIYGLATLLIRQQFTVRATKGSPLTVNTLVRVIIRYEGVQLHLGFSVVNLFFSTFFWDILSYKTQSNY